MFKKKGLMLDCSRNAVRTVKTVKKLADIMQKLDFNTLMLYTEDTYEIDTQPYFGYLRGRYTKDELREIDAYCAEKGIELIPCIQTLAHLNGIVDWEVYREITDCNDILLVGDSRVYGLIDDMLRNISETFTTKKIHIGMDEAWSLGLGKYLRQNGYTNPTEIMRFHLDKVSKIAEKYGLEPMMWSDMFFRVVSDGYYIDDPSLIDDVIRKTVPENVTPVYWDYYSLDKTHYDKMMQAHKNFGKSFWFAGGLWTWKGFTPHNLFSVETSKTAIASCIDYGVENIFFTMWGDNGAETSPFAVLPSMYYVSCLLRGVNDEGEIKAGFKELFGIDYDDFAAIDIPELNRPDGGRVINVNSEKYMLYNDYFLGIYDSITDSSRNVIYKNTADKIKKLADDKNFGYLFKNIYSLMEVLAVKNDLGIRTRSAYKEQNRQELKAIVADYEKTEKLLADFLNAFTSQWYEENKPFGIEIHETRIGGLIQRTKSCRKRLEKYLSGDIDRIEELEQTILDPECNPDGGKRELSKNEWSKYFVNVM